MGRRPTGICCALACALLASCTPSDDRYCKLGTTQVVADTASKMIDGLAIARFEQGALLAWSDSFGVFARTLDSNGKPSAPPLRVGERCDGGVALAASSAGLALACLQRAVPRDVERTGNAVVYAIARHDGQLGATERTRYSPAGSLSEGIALTWVDAPMKGDPPALALAWHDASPDVQRVWLVSDASGKHPAPAQVVSTEGSVARAPMLVADGPRLALTWSERLARGDSVESGSMLWTGEARLDAARGKTHAVVQSGDGHGKAGSWVEPLPQLAFLNGQLIIGFRAPGQHGKKPGLTLARIQGSTGPHGVMTDPRASEANRVGRADGVGSPSITACMRGLITATPRSYSGDYFIGINWLSSALSHPRREQQFYEDAYAFTQAATVCLGEHALIALAELPQLDRPKAELHIATYACE